MKYDYRKPPVCQPDGDYHKKYFYVVLLIKSHLYDIKGQAIVFRRRTIQSLQKLLYDFDHTYLHTSITNDFDKKQMGKRYSNVQFLVKYDSRLQDVLALIDPMSYVIKLSWHQQPTKPPCRPILPIPPKYHYQQCIPHHKHQCFNKLQILEHKRRQSQMQQYVEQMQNRLLQLDNTIKDNLTGRLVKVVGLDQNIVICQYIEQDDQYFGEQVTVNRDQRVFEIGMLGKLFNNGTVKSIVLQQQIVQQSYSNQQQISSSL